MTNVVFLVLIVGVVLPIYSTGKTLNSAITRNAESTPAAPGEFPYHVSLQSKSGKHRCSGSIISNNAVLTAANCVYGLSPKDYVVLAGTNKLNSGGTAFGIESFKHHEDYNPLAMSNDIALIKLSSNIAFSTTVSPVELEHSNSAEPRAAVLTGWGHTSNDLQKIIIKSRPVEECQKYYPIDKSHLCTLDESGRPACMGEAGGPLTIGSVLVGVAAWGLPCNRGTPDIYSSVVAYKNWIESVID